MTALDVEVLARLRELRSIAVDEGRTLVERLQAETQRQRLMNEALSRQLGQGDRGGR